MELDALAEGKLPSGGIFHGPLGGQCGGGLEILIQADQAVVDLHGGVGGGIAASGAVEGGNVAAHADVESIPLDFSLFSAAGENRHENR